MHLPRLHIETRPIEHLIAYSSNARTHSDEQVAEIAASISEFGFNNPVLIDVDAEIIAGHGRVLAARKLGWTEIPVIVLGHLTPNQKRAFRLADNKLALNAGWDEELLRLELEALQAAQVDLSITGFDEQELENLLAAAAAEACTDADEVPEPAPLVISRPGDLWMMGRHAVLCGDGTDAASLRLVLRDCVATMIFTDLPYNVDYAGKGPDRLKMANDNLGSAFGVFLDAACAGMLEVCSGPLYLCMSSSELHTLHRAFTAAGGHWSTYIVWAKDLFTLGRSDYQRQYEPILYGWREGARHYWCGARDQSDVWFVNRSRSNAVHPTMKPVELVQRAIVNSSRESDVILDPFAGSGTTAIACEGIGRSARMVEIDPRYVDVIVRRWQAYTGQTAYLENNGGSFEQVTADRRAPVRQGCDHE
jgi:DNA modification methylase